MGDRRKNIDSAINFLSSSCGIIKSISSIYESEPWGFDDSNNFFNIAILINTDFTAVELLQRILEIEKIMGRVRDNSKGYTSRIIDIDILFYNNEIIKETDLEIPHPLIQERRFALLPVMDISPKFVHPIFNLTIEELLFKCPDKSIVKKISK